jgi:hypothetical protein
MTTATTTPGMTGVQIFEAIQKHAGVDINTLRQGMTFLWIPPGSPPGTAATQFKRANASPFNAKFAIFNLFREGDEVRVYELPKADARPDNEDDVLAPRCVTLSPTGAFVEAMSLQSFIEAVGDEWSRVESECTTADKEKLAILAYGEELAPDYALSEFLDDLRDDVHRELVDDDDPEPEPAPENPPGASPATPPPIVG